jgi:hypothetical protein
VAKGLLFTVTGGDKTPVPAGRSTNERYEVQNQKTRIDRRDGALCLYRNATTEPGRHSETTKRLLQMSCRIDRVVGADNLIVLYISGTISGQHVDTLRNLLRQEAGALAIDLKNVSLVDREAVQLLVLTEDSGMELRNCPAYIRDWVTRERADKDSDGSGQRTGRREGVDDV